MLLETLACGVCHSDLHLWEGYYDLGGGKRIFVKDRGVALPLTMGHEVVGRVMDKGPAASGVEIGDVRLLYPWIGCGACPYCAADTPHMCRKPRSLGVFSHGGYSDRVWVRDARYLVEIGDLPPETACSYACAGLTAYSALKKALPLARDEHLVLIGAGGLGMMAAQVVPALTEAPVIVVDVDDRKLEAVGAFGAFTTLNAKREDAGAGIMDLTRGVGASSIVDFVNTSETAALAFSVTAKNGIHVMVGLFGGELTLPTPVLPLKNATLRGSYTGSLAELRELIRLVHAHKLPPLPVTCHPMEHAEAILEDLRAGNVVGRAVLQPNHRA